MKFINNNKELLKKYLGIIIFNVITYILIGFYFKNMEYNFLIMFALTIIIDLVILNIKESSKCIIWLDFITCLIVGFLLSIFIKDDLTYSVCIFSFYLANNFIFCHTRKETKFFKIVFQYAISIFIILASMFINLAFFVYIFK